MAGVGTTNISLNSLRTAWGNAGYAGGSDPGSTNISLSEFRGATFTGGTSVPSSGEISINDDFKGKTFGTSGPPTYETGSFKVYDNWSAAPSFLASYVSNTRAQLNSGNSSYASILFTPNASSATQYTSPGIEVTGSGKVDEVTLWLEADTESTYSQLGFGILAKDMWKTGSSISSSSYTLEAKKWKEQLAERDNKYATFSDALGFHGYGYHNYAGSRDDITSSTNVSTATSPYNWKSTTYQSGLGPLTTYFHNILGKTGGTVRSTAHHIVNNSYYFYKTHWDNYAGYRGTGSAKGNYGLKIKWYSKTLNVRLTKNSSKITTQGSNWTNTTTTNTGLVGIFSGMYIEDNSSWPCTNGNVFIGKIYLDEITMYQELASSLTEYSASWSDSNATKDVTITISGYLYWTLATTSTYSNPKILGPPHTVLPRYQVSSANTTSNPREITEWAFYMNDVTSGTTNTFKYDIRTSNPSGTAFSYAVTYAAKPSASYEFGIMNTTGSYTIYESNASTVSSITPSGSGYNHTSMANNNINWRYYSMGLKWKIINAGKIVGVGVNARYGGKISIFINGYSASGGTNITVNGNSLTSNTINYKYTLLSNPVSVSANDIVQIIFKNTTGGYCWTAISAFDFTNTSSGNLQVQSGGYRSTGNTVTSPLRPYNHLAYGYGATDMIFLPD